MRRLLQRGWAKFRREGLISLIYSTRTFLYRKALFWYWGDSISISSRDTTVEVKAKTYAEKTHIYLFHRSEIPTLNRLLEDIRDDDVFYDIGANVGLYTCFTTARLGSGQVVSFEPHPANHQRLCENLDQNGLDATTIEAVVSNESGTTEFVATGREAAGHGTASISSSTSESETLVVDSVVIDELLALGNLPRPDVLKIDVEGAEYFVLDGMRDTLEGVRLIYCEVHPEGLHDFSVNEMDVLELLYDAGFRIERLHDKTPYQIRASK